MANDKGLNASVEALFDGIVFVALNAASVCFEIAIRPTRGALRAINRLRGKSGSKIHPTSLYFLAMVLGIGITGLSGGEFNRLLRNLSFAPGPELMDEFGIILDSTRIASLIASAVLSATVYYLILSALALVLFRAPRRRNTFIAGLQYIGASQIILTSVVIRLVDIFIYRLPFLERFLYSGPKGPYGPYVEWSVVLWISLLPLPFCVLAMKRGDRIHFIQRHTSIRILIGVLVALYLYAANTFGNPAITPPMDGGVDIENRIPVLLNRACEFRKSGNESWVDMAAVVRGSTSELTLTDFDKLVIFTVTPSLTRAETLEYSNDYILSTSRRPTINGGAAFALLEGKKHQLVRLRYPLTASEVQKLKDAKNHNFVCGLGDQVLLGADSKGVFDFRALDDNDE